MNPLRWLARLFRPAADQSRDPIWPGVRCRKGYVSPPGSWRAARGALRAAPIREADLEGTIRAIAAAPEFQPWNPSPDDPLIDELGDDDRERS